TSMATRSFAPEAAGLLNQANDPHSNSSRLTSFALMNLPVICFLSAYKCDMMTRARSGARFLKAYDLCMKTIALMLGALMLGAVTMLLGQESQIRVIAFGAHPDDCDIRAAGSAALWKKMGAAVKFVSITNGDVGHQTIHGEELARRRLGEAKES